MESLNEYRALVAVVEAGSIRGASKASDLPRSTLSRAIQRLEERLDVELFERSGGMLSVTEAGRLLYERSRDFLDDIAASEAAVQRLQQDRDQVLVVSIPRTSGNPLLVDLIGSFAEAHPDLDLEVIATNRYVDLDADRVDVAIRAGRIGPADHVARKIAGVEWGLYAAPERFSSRELPESPDMLWGEPLVVAMTGAGEVMWPFGVPLAERARIALRTTDFAIAQQAIARGLGIGVVPMLQAGTGAQRIMADIFSAHVDLCAFFRREDRNRPAVRAFVEHAARQLEESIGA